MVRKVFNWTSVTGDEDGDVRWDAAVIGKKLAVGPEEHVGLVKLRGFEIALSTGQDFRLSADVAKLADGADYSSEFQPIELVRPSHSALLDRGSLWLHVDDADSFVAEDVVIEPIEVFESMLFQKALTASWIISIDYLILEGPMRWPIEDYMKDIRKVGRQRTAGRPFFQAGDINVLFEQN